MTPEVQDFLSLRNLLLFGGALLASTVVSILRVNRERSALLRDGKPPTTLREMWVDAGYGTLAALALLLMQDTIKPLPIKAAIALAMFYGSVGPAAWDFFTALAGGKYTVSKKEEEK